MGTPLHLCANERRALTQTSEQPAERPISADMEQGVHISPTPPTYDGSFHHHDYSLDVAHTNLINMMTTNSPLEELEATGNKRQLETTEMSEDDAKRLKTTTEEMKANNAASTNKQWDAMFERLVAYKQRNGHCLVPKRYVEDPKLGTWVETQRVQYKRLQREYDETRGVEAVQPNKRLNQGRLQKLQDIGFAWSAKHVRKPRSNSLPSMPNPMDVAIPSPDASVTMATIFPTATAIAAGVGMHSAIVPTVAPPARPRKSDSRQAGRLNDHQWEEMYQRLVGYKQEHGDCLVPRKYERDPKLSTWVETQRFLWNRDYRSIAGGLASHEMEQDHEFALATAAAATAGLPTEMESITPLPDPGELPNAAPLLEWPGAGDMQEGEDSAVVAAAAAAAAEVVDKEVGSPGGGAGHEVVMTTTTTSPKDSPSQPKRLTKERKEKLDALGFVWSLRNKRIDDHWDEMFRQLVEYKDRYGDCLVPSRYEANLKLGKWVETQRYEYTKLKRAEATDPNAKVEAKIEEPYPQEDPKNANGKPRITNARLTEERLRRLESIGFEWKVRNKMKRYYDKQWQDMFDQLMDFKHVNGHTMVPKRYPDNPRLANWVHTQRIQYRKLMSGARKENGYREITKQLAEETGASDFTLSKEEERAGDYKLSKEDEISFRLTEERRRKLEEVGFIWSVRESDAKADQNRMTRNSYDDLWDAMYERLKVYKEKYGNCLVPKRSKEDPKLGTWVDTQRVQYKKMKKKLADKSLPVEELMPSPEEIQDALNPNKPVVGRLTEDRIRRLNDLGFIWSLRDDWTKHYDELREFKRVHGHCNVPARYAQNRRLGIWVSAQRQQLKQMQSSSPLEGVARTSALTQDRIDLLNELVFTWTIRSRDLLGESWNQRLQELREYKAIFGNCLVPSRYPPNPELGIWVGTQRTQYRLFIKAQESGQKILGSSGMNEERIKQLEELGFVWALRGPEGGRKDETVLQDGEDFSSDSLVAIEPSQHSHSLQQAEPLPEEVSHNQLTPNRQTNLQHQHHEPHHNHPTSNQEDILEESSVMEAYHSVLEV